jgi:hypothetical protein
VMSEKRVNTHLGDKHEPLRKRVKMKDLESVVAAGNFIIGLGLNLHAYGLIIQSCLCKIKFNFVFFFQNFLLVSCK